MTPILIWKRNNAAKCEYCKEIIKGPGLVDVRVDNHERTCPKNPKAPLWVKQLERQRRAIAKRPYTTEEEKQVWYADLSNCLKEIEPYNEAESAGILSTKEADRLRKAATSYHMYSRYAVRARSEGKAVKSESEWTSEQESKNNSAKVPAGWTFGGGGKDLANWKGQSTENVLNVFGNPPDQAKPWGQGGGAWTYNNLNITDAKGNPHKSVTFFVQNGAVVGVGLPSTQEH
jgi:hypothetical protein